MDEINRFYEQKLLSNLYNLLFEHKDQSRASPLQLWPLLALVEASLMLASLWAGVKELLNSSAV